MHRNKTPGRNQGQAATFLIGVATFLVLLPLLMFSHRQSRTTAAAKRRLTSGQYDTLVIYNFGYFDPEHLGNFNYFIKHGIRGNDGARYAIILEHLIATELLDLPPFPSNVQVPRFLLINTHFISPCIPGRPCGRPLQRDGVGGLAAQALPKPSPAQVLRVC